MPSCAPLLNVKKLGGGPSDIGPKTYEALLLMFGMLGVAIGAFQWTISPWFVQLKQAAAEWLIDRDILWPLESGAPWWLLTNHPEAGDVFTWLDGAAILAWIFGMSWHAYDPWSLHSDRLKT